MNTKSILAIAALALVATSGIASAATFDRQARVRYGAFAAIPGEPVQGQVQIINGIRYGNGNGAPIETLRFPGDNSNDQYVNSAAN